MKFRKKPVVIEATQWKKNGDHPDDYADPVQGFENGELVEFDPEHCKLADWEGQVVRRFNHPQISGLVDCHICQTPMCGHGWIDTLEGGHNVCPGDWIITGIKGERYPCEPDIFEATYEPLGIE